MLNELVGADGISEAFLHKLPLMAITDPDRFKKIDIVVSNFMEMKEDMEAAEEKTMELCKKCGVDYEQFTVAATKDGAWSAIRELMDKSKNPLKRWVQQFSGEYDAELEELAGERKIYDSLRDSYKAHLQEVAKKLALTLSGNEDMRESLATFMRGETLPKEEMGLSFEELKKAHTDILATNKGELDDAWSEYQVAHPGITDFDAEKPEFLKKFLQNKKLKGKKGGWANVGVKMYIPVFTELWSKP